MTKKFASMFLALVMCLSLSAPAWAVEEHTSNKENAVSHFVSTETMNQIYANHLSPQAMAATINSEDTPSIVDEIYDELSFIYPRIGEVQEKYNASKCEKDKQALLSLTSRKNDLEASLANYGHIILSDDEVHMIFGSGTGPVLGSPEKPFDTPNNKYTLSPVISLVQNGKYIDYFYVTAIPLTTKSYLHASYNIDIKKGNALGFVGEIISVYSSKALSAGLEAANPILSLLPYELLSFTPNTRVTSDYQIRASYTSTARFVWAGWREDLVYGHEATFHSTSVSEVHTMVSVDNGRTITDTKQKDYREDSKHYNSIGQFVANHFKYGEDGTWMLETNTFEYYYTDANGNKKLCKKQKAPYATYYIDSDEHYGLN